MAVHVICNVGYVPSVGCFYEGGVRYRVCPAASKAHAVETVSSWDDGDRAARAANSPPLEHEQRNPRPFSPT